MKTLRIDWKSLDRKERLRIVLRTLSLIVLFASITAFVVLEIRQIQADKAYRDLRSERPTVPVDSIFDSPSAAPSLPEGTPEPTPPYVVILSSGGLMTSDGVLPEYIQLYKQNPQLAGWLTFPGWTYFPIDYPVMYSGDNEAYLRHDFNKQYSTAGCLFFDGDNDPKSLSRNFVVYGHAMRAKHMFGNLTDLPSKPKVCNANRYIYVDLLWTRLKYEVFSTYYIPASGDYRRSDFASDAEFLAYAEVLKSRSTFDYGVTLSPGDRLLTLSTCQNAIEGNRVAVHARLVAQVLYERSSQSTADISGPPEGVTGLAVPTLLVLTPRPTGVTDIPTPTATVEPTPEATAEPTQDPTPVPSPEATPAAPTT